ncbi:MAG: FGGY-family carbohydrate kinase [Candidatus Hydrogenedentes bacterium]|nr:FGGY-family carbohydrate kinase [Candidatus Hydrogenedentota bacterium]
MLIGADLGTTALKVALYDPKTGNRIAGESADLPIDAGVDGRREQAPDAIVRALARAVRRIGQAAGGLDRVSGIGLASQGGSGIVADRKSGRALTPMVLWNDARAFPLLPAIAAERTASFWRARTLRDDPGMGLARLRQLSEEAPALVCPENIYAGAGDYLYHHLTGQWRQDACHALQTGCYDARTGALSRDLPAIAGIHFDFFPALRQGHETFPLGSAAARRLGLPVGIPVAGPYMDHEAGYLATAGLTPDPIQCSLGTAWVGNFQLPATFTGYAPIQFSIPAPAGDGRLVIHPLLTGNVTWDWALREFVDPRPARALAEQARILDQDILPPPGLVALPWLNQPNPLAPDLLGGCALLGAGPATDRADLLRAVASGMCFELHRVFESAATHGAVGSLVLSGGASRSPHFQQLIAALFEPLPVWQLDDAAWMGTRGCLWAFSRRAARAGGRRVRPDGTVDRNALARGRKLYEEAFARIYGKVRAGRAYEVRPEGSVS